MYRNGVCLICFNTSYIIILLFLVSLHAGGIPFDQSFLTLERCAALFLTMYML